MLAKNLWKIMDKDPRIGFETANHYFYTEGNLREKVPVSNIKKKNVVSENFTDPGTEKMEDIQRLARVEISKVPIREQEVKEDKRAVVSMRRFFAVSFKGLYNFRETRIRLLQATDSDMVFSILSEIKEKKV